METVDDYLVYLDEDFNFVNKVFKANLLKNITKKVKRSVKGNKVNVPALKTALKPIPVLTQDKINKFLDKYAPNYTPNYNVAKKHFDKKFPDRKDNDILAGFTAAATSIDKKRTLQDNLKKVDRLYRSSLGTSPAGGLLILLIVGMGLTMTSWSAPEFFDGVTTQFLGVTLGVLMMIAAVVSAFR